MFCGPPWIWKQACICLCTAIECYKCPRVLPFDGYILHALLHMMSWYLLTSTCCQGSQVRALQVKCNQGIPCLMSPTQSLPDLQEHERCVYVMSRLELLKSETDFMKSGLVVIGVEDSLAKKFDEYM